MAERKRMWRHAKPSKKHPSVLVEIESLAWGGRGVGRAEGKVVFVSKTVPGDKVLVEVLKEKTKYAEGRVKALFRPSPDRVPPRCKFFDHCGGCQWLAFAYERQPAEKEKMVRSFLRRHLEGCVVNPVVPAEPATAYRHRGEFHIAPMGKSVRMGFFRESSHKVVNLDFCRLFNESFNDAYSKLRKVLATENATRSLKKIVIAQSEDGESIAAHFLAGRSLEASDAPRLTRLAFSLGFTGALVTPAGNQRLELASEGDTSIAFKVPADGDGKTITLRADVRSFTQAHYRMNRVLVKQVLEMVKTSSHASVLDLYSGIGNLSLPLAGICAEITAVEQSPFASLDAKRNTGANGIKNVKHIESDAVGVVKEMVDAGKTFDAVVLDPPREGAAGLPELIPRLGAKRVVYVSCSLPTLERDLDAFREQGYVLSEVVPIDLFPHTYSVETTCLLRRTR